MKPLRRYALGMWPSPAAEALTETPEGSSSQASRRWLIWSRCTLLLTLVAALTATRATGQNTFTVTCPTSLPFTSYDIDGHSNPTLTVVRGQSYSFTLVNCGFHPFNIQTTPGWPVTTLYSHVTNNGSTSASVMLTMPIIETANNLYYQCGNHSAMNGTLNVVDSMATTPTFTAASTQTPSNTLTTTPTGTPTPTRTPTATTTKTPTSTSTITPTTTPTPSRTPTTTPTAAPPPTPTITPTGTITRTPLQIPTDTPTATPPGTPIGTPTRTLIACPVAQLINPVPGSTLPAGAVTFEWCNASADYFLTVEGIPGAHDIFNAFAGGVGPGAGVVSVTLGPACALAPPIGCIPTNGETIYVTLWTLKQGNVLPPSPFSYTFTAANVAATPTSTPTAVAFQMPTATGMPTQTPAVSVTPAGTPTVTPTTATPTPIPCVGDCNSSGQVTVDEILTLVNVALGNANVSTCAAGDVNGNRQITVDEILAAVNNALNGCS